ncbi:MAG: hypothetical protein V3V01_12845 [Acidimicrobiales bacterium]
MLTISARLASCVVLVTGIILSQLASPQSAEAYPQDPRDCTRSAIEFQFKDDWGDWTATEKSLYTEAVERLEVDAKNHKGNSYIQVAEKPAPFNEDVTLTLKLNEDSIANVGLGHSDSALPFGQGCNDVWINKNINPSLNAIRRNTWWKVSRHETFHIAGAHHSGKSDSRDGDGPPTMVTCYGVDYPFSGVNTLSSDDEAYIGWLHNGLAHRQIHPNLGFEQGRRDWKAKRGNLIVVTGSAVAQNGSKYASFLATGTRWNSYIYKRIRLWTGDDDEMYQSYGYVSRANIATTASAMTRLYRRTMIEGPANGCSYEDGIVNPNRLFFGGNWVKASDSGMDTSIAAGNTMQLQAGGWQNPPEADGYVLEIRAYGKAHINGNTTGLRWDNVTGVGT